MNLSGKIKKDIVTFIFVLTILIVGQTVYAESMDKPVSISNNYFQVGESIDAIVDASVDLLKWYVADEEVSEGNSYNPVVDDYEKWIVVKAFDGDICVGEDKIYFGKLPVLYINTDDGKDINSKTEYKSAQMSIKGNNSIDTTSYDGGIAIKGRGNGSWGYPKKPYKFKLDKSTDLFGKVKISTGYCWQIILMLV